MSVKLNEKLKHVKLKKTDTCVSYALRRIGMEEKRITDYNSFISSDKFKISDFCGTEELEISDLLMWDIEIETGWVCNEILSDGPILLSNKEMFFYHFGVVEGLHHDKCLFSDVFFGDNSPEIRIRDLFVLEKLPNKVAKIINK